MSAAEEWRPIPGYGGRYEASDQGRIRNQATGRVLSDSNVKGYRKVSLFVGRTVTKQVHPLVMEAFVGTCPDGHEVDHRDHDRANNRLGNLRYRVIESNRMDRVCRRCRVAGHDARTCFARETSAPVAELTDAEFAALLDDGLNAPEPSHA